MVEKKQMRVIPELEEEIINIMKENNLEGRGAMAVCQEKAVEYIKVGREVERMYNRMTLGLFARK